MLRMVIPSILFQSPGLERKTCSSGTFRGSNQTLYISKLVMILACVASAISAVDPTSSWWPSATTMASAFGKSSTFTGLSGLVTKGLMSTTLPVGDVRRKIDQENHSSFTGAPAANAVPDQAKVNTASASQRSRDCFNCDMVAFP